MANPISNRRRRYASTLRSVILLAASALGNPLHAQAVAPPLWSRDSIRSTILSETRIVRISLPVGYDTPEYASERYPVLIVLDGGAGVTLAAAIANARAMGGTNAPAIPRLIIVGVENLGGTRFRDMTLPPADESVKRDDGGGGAPAFLRFLSSELRPYIAARYRTQAVSVLAGHSLSGFFTAWAFGQAPDFLMGAIATSPTPHEQRRVLDGILARTAPGRLFLVSGSSELGLDRAAQSFAAALNSQPASGRSVEHLSIPEVSHDHTGYLGMVPGLRFIFRPVSLAGYQLIFSDDERWLSRFNAYFDSTRASYMRGAGQLGLPARLPLSFLTSQSRWYQDTKTAPLLLRLCQELMTSYSTLWHGYECAGDAQARLGRATEGLANYRHAIDAARSGGDTTAAARITRKAEGLRAPQLFR